MLLNFYYSIFFTYFLPISSLYDEKVYFKKKIFEIEVFEEANGDVSLCVETICPKGFEPIPCTKVQNGNGCRKCSEGYFSSGNTYRKRLPHSYDISAWVEKFCIKR